MVKKLFKHEFLAYIRALLPMHLILLGIAALTRFVCFFENDSDIYAIVSVSSIIAFIVACVVCLVMSFVNVITRYYKNMFTHEGYLTLTLPVSNTQHILTKVTTGVVSIIVSIITVVLGICIATAGEFTVELIKAIVYIFKQAQKAFEGHFVFYMIEFMILFVVALFTYTLLYYACISIGQLSKKNRVTAAIGAFFAYYFITQIIGTIGIIVMQDFVNTQLFEDIIVFIGRNPYLSVHIFMFGSILITALLGLLYFAVSNYVLKKKLNLE